MEKRSFERVAANLRVEFDCSHTICCGAVVNLSENGMLLRAAELCFPLDMQFEIYMSLKGEIVEVPVKVSRLIKSDKVYDGIGIEIITPPKIYLEFVRDLKGELLKLK